MPCVTVWLSNFGIISRNYTWKVNNRKSNIPVHFRYRYRFRKLACFGKPTFYRKCYQECYQKWHYIHAKNSVYKSILTTISYKPFISAPECPRTVLSVCFGMYAFGMCHIRHLSYVIYESLLTTQKT